MYKNNQARITIRFRRWTRKGYAAFASLGQCVTIGRLRKNVTERALNKQTTPTLAPSLQKQETESETNKESRQTDPWSNKALRMELHSLHAVSTFTPEPHDSLRYLLQIAIKTHRMHQARCTLCVFICIPLLS